MQLSEEENQKQNAITDAIKNQQPVEDLAETCNSEDEAKISKSITMGLTADPFVVSPKKKLEEQDNKQNEQDGEEVMGLMGDIHCPPPEKKSPVKKFFRKLFGKGE